jgi:hypothetical protein
MKRENRKTQELVWAFWSNNSFKGIGHWRYSPVTEDEAAVKEFAEEQKTCPKNVMFTDRYFRKVLKTDDCQLEIVETKHCFAVMDTHWDVRLIEKKSGKAWDTTIPDEVDIKEEKQVKAFLEYDLCYNKLYDKAWERGKATKWESFLNKVHFTVYQVKLLLA